MAEDAVNFPSKAIVYDDNGNVKTTKQVYIHLVIQIYIKASMN